MRAVRLGFVPVATMAAIFACSGTKAGSGFGQEPNDSGVPPSVDGSQPPPTGDGSPSFGDSGGFDSPPPDGSVTVATTIYANTDTTLYSMDPMSQAVTPVGMFAGMSDSSTDSTVTDVAVDAAGDVYVNTESVVYKAILPASPSATATVMLTHVATLTSAEKFYALAFAPAGAIGSTEALVGGDGNGELWAINTTSGATQDLGSFGADTTTAGYSYVLSGDIVFYNDASNTPTGLATIRACKTTKLTECYPAGEPSDYLAGIDMTALAGNFTNNTTNPVLKGIYGGSSSSPGAGTGYVKLFGLGAWNSSVFAFSRNDEYDASGQPPSLISIETAAGSTQGKGTVISASFPFTNGWSGAGVSTKVTIIVPPPPPPPS